MTDSIDGLTRPPIGTPSMTTKSSGLALSEIRTTKSEEVYDSNQEAVNSSSKYLATNRSTTAKCSSSSSSHTPPQLGLQHGKTVGTNLRDKSGLPLLNRCALSDQQVTRHHLRKNIFKPNQQDMTSSNGAI
jgi:hypothetical protein